MLFFLMFVTWALFQFRLSQHSNDNIHSYFVIPTLNFTFCNSDRDGVAKVDRSYVYILLGDLITLFSIMRAFYLCCLAPFLVLKSWWAHFQSDVTQLTAFDLYHEGAFVSHLYQIPLRTEENQRGSSSQNDFFSP